MNKLVVTLAAVIIVGAFLPKAMADVEVYGSARFRTYYKSADSGKPDTDSDDDLEWRIGHRSRFGANFRSDRITGKFEMDARAGTAGSTAKIESSSGASGLGNMKLRHLWGQWDFGVGKLMVGQNWPLYNALVSGINYYNGGLLKFGGMKYASVRTSQLRLTFGDFKLALLQTDTTQTSPSTTFEEVNVIFPKVELRYDMKMDAFALTFIGGYQNYEIEDKDGTRRTEDITSWVLGVRGKANFGSAYLNGSLTYRQNGGNYGVHTNVDETAAWVADSLNDAKAFGFVSALGYKLSDRVTLEASCAWVESKFDNRKGKDDSSAIGFLVKFTVAQGVIIQPELIFQDNGDGWGQTPTYAIVDQGDITTFGVWWKIVFK